MKSACKMKNLLPYNIVGMELIVLHFLVNLFGRAVYQS